MAARCITMSPDRLHEFSRRTAFNLPEDSAQLNHLEAADVRLRTTRDLGTAFSLVAQETGPQPQVRFRVVLEGKPQPLDPFVFEHAYSIGREALLNAFRHSQATRIDLHLADTPKGLSLTIRDNGLGISADSFHMRGKGLSWMKGLAEGIGATLKLLSRDSAGTEVRLSIPGQIAFAA
jgi:signal transduction histidine kinase